MLPHRASSSLPNGFTGGDNSFASSTLIDVCNEGGGVVIGEDTMIRNGGAMGLISGEATAVVSGTSGNVAMVNLPTSSYHGMSNWNGAGMSLMGGSNGGAIYSPDGVEATTGVLGDKEHGKGSHNGKMMDSMGGGTTTGLQTVDSNAASSWNGAAVNSTGVGTTAGVTTFHSNAANSCNSAAVMNSTGGGTSAGVMTLDSNAASSWNDDAVNSTGVGMTTGAPILNQNAPSSWNAAAVNSTGVGMTAGAPILNPNGNGAAVNSTCVGTTVGAPVLNQNAASSWNGAALNSAGIGTTAGLQTVDSNAASSWNGAAVNSTGVRTTVGAPVSNQNAASSSNGVATIDSTGNGTTSLVPALTPNGASSWNVAAVNTAGVNSTGVGTTVGVPVLNQNAASSWNGAAVNGAATTATVTNEAMVVDATVNDDEQTSLLQLGFRPTVSLPLDDEVCSEQESPLQLYTEDEKQRIFALSARIKEQFPVGNGKWWPNKHSLRDELQACGRVEGFKVRTEGDEFICCKARHPRAKEAALEAKKEATLPSKKRKSNSKIAGCGFSISIAKAKDQRNKPEDAPSGAYYIVNASYEHSNGCTPCAAQLVALNHSGGVYQKKLFKHDKLSTLLDIERSGGWSTRNYREFLRSYIYPELACITSAMIANIRIKVKRLVDLIDNGSATITAEHAADVFAKDDSIKSKLSLDEEADFISRSTNAREILREVLTLNSTDGQAVINYLQKLAIADPGFTYRVARDTENNPTGFIWMTGAMRRQFEIYGDVIFLDCMKRQINTVNWPYIAPVIVDGDSHIFVIAECLICAERLEGYAWVLESIFEMAPKRGRESLRIIFGDGIMSTRLLDMVGIGETCKLCLDVYHLLDVDWPRFFGSAYFLTIRSFFSDLVYSKSEDEYGSNLAKIRVKLQRNHQHLHYLENEIHSQRQKFVHCWVSSIEGNLMRHGDSPAESNHSSFVARIGPIATVEPATAVMHIMERHDELCRVRHCDLTGYYFRTKDEKAKANERWARMTATDREIARARDHLCEGGLKIWKANLEKAAGYRCKDLPNGEKEIQAIDFDPAINCIRIISDTKRCDCASRVAFLAPCRHEICADAMSFRMDRWPERFYLRQCLEISMPETQSVTLLEGSASFAMTSNSSSALGSTECGLDCEMINDTVDWGDNHDDGSEEGYVMGETDNDGVAGKENRTPAWSRKAKYARIQSLAQQATESIIQSKDWEMFCGILIEITEAAKGDSSAFLHAFTTSNRLSAPRKDELEDKSRRYAASFTSYRPSAGIFSGSSQDDVSAPPLQPRTGGTNHPTKKRFRSGHDKFKLTSSQRNAPRCGFCQSTQHNIRNCEKLKSLNGTLIPNKESLNVFAESAGSPNKFNVELAPQELQRLFSAIDWDVSLPWPREAEHVVVIRFFLGPQQVVASSRYACRSAQCDSRSNIAEVDFYSRAGERILLENPQSRFYRVDKLCTLLSDHVKGTKKLINTVSSPKKMRGDDFIYG